MLDGVDDKMSVQGSDLSSPLKQLSHQLAENGSSAKQFRRLAEDIAAAELFDALTGSDKVDLTCDEAEAVLDRFVDDELSGHAMEPLHQQVQTHVDSCPRCRQSYELLLTTLRQEQAGQLLVTPLPARPALSFLREPAPDTAWTTHLNSQLRESAFGLRIALSWSYLQTLLAPPPALLVRAEDDLTRPLTRLILSDVIPVGKKMLTVEVIAVRAAQHADQVALQAFVATNSGTLPPNLYARLVWADEVRFVPVTPEGGATFGAVSIHTLQAETGKVEITFEVRGSNDHADLQPL